MPKKPEIIELDLDEKLSKSRRQATSMSLPMAVHHRLDVLADLAEDAGASRAEIVGMLVAEADLDPDALADAIVAYRRKRVGDIVPEQPAPAVPGEKRDNVVAFEKRGPGRPRRKAG